MRSWGRRLACVLLLALVACPGHLKGTSPAKKATVARPPRARAEAPAGLPRVVLQVGTSFQAATLSSFCDGKRCRKGSSAPAAFIEGSDPLFFILSGAPRSARLEVRRPGATALADQATLHPSNTMVYDPDVRPGRYLVTLEASWGRRVGRWVFGVLVPERR